MFFRNSDRFRQADGPIRINRMTSYQASNAKQGFHWKTIEEKPENWEFLQRLIQSVMEVSTPKEELDAAHIEKMIDIFLSIFPETKELFYLEKMGGAGTDKQTGSKKLGVNYKKKISLKYEIRDRVEEERIRSDLSLIRWTPEGRPATTSFKFEVTFFLMILKWNHQFVFQKKTVRCDSNLVDAIISLNRILKEEGGRIERGSNTLFQGMTKIQGRMNSIVNRKMMDVLFTNPRLLVESTADARSHVRQLYPEQSQLLDQVSSAIQEKRPLLIGNQMPTGTGKTFLAVPLAQRLNRIYCQKTVLFACSNELVTEDVARTALLGDNLHLWMAKLIRDEKNTGKIHVLLRPHKRCFPEQWKKVYKMNSQEKIGSIVSQWNFYREKINRSPDIIVADLEACYRILQQAPAMGDPFVAYIDEYISDKESNRWMGRICRWLPRQTVLLSAILPDFSVMAPILESFRERHDPLCQYSSEMIFHRVNTLDIPITCTIIDPQGRLRFPHHQVETREDLDELCDEIQKNPRLRRCYTPKHVFFWSKSIDALLQEEKLDFSHKFPNIGDIRNLQIIEYVIQILFCWRFRFEEWKGPLKAYSPEVMEPLDSAKLFTDHSYQLDGKTLWVSHSIQKKVSDNSVVLFQPPLDFDEMVRTNRLQQQQVQARIQQLEERKIDRSRLKKGSSIDFSRLEKERQLGEIVDHVVRMELPAFYVINSKDHFFRFHGHDESKRSFLSTLNRTSIVLPEEFYQAFDAPSNLNMMAGIGVYTKNEMTSYQRNLCMTQYSKFCFLCSGKEIVYGTNLPHLVNVWISRDFSDQESVSTLYQLMGRVGRLGRSYHARIILEDEGAVRRILSWKCDADTLSEMETLLETFHLK